MFKIPHDCYNIFPRCSVVERAQIRGSAGDPHFQIILNKHVFISSYVDIVIYIYHIWYIIRSVYVSLHSKIASAGAYC